MQSDSVCMHNTGVNVRGVIGQQRKCIIVLTIRRRCVEMISGR